MDQAKQMAGGKQQARQVASPPGEKAPHRPVMQAKFGILCLEWILSAGNDQDPIGGLEVAGQLEGGGEVAAGEVADGGLGGGVLARAWRAWPRAAGPSPA